MEQACDGSRAHMLRIEFSGHWNFCGYLEGLRILERSADIWKHVKGIALNLVDGNNTWYICTYRGIF